MTLDGVQIPAHEQVLVCLGSANRDPDRFPAPDVLDIGRDDGPNLGFGHGPCSAVTRDCGSPSAVTPWPGRTATAWSCAASCRSLSFSGLPGDMDKRPSDPIETSGEV